MPRGQEGAAKQRALGYRKAVGIGVVVARLASIDPEHTRDRGTADLPRGRRP